MHNSRHISHIGSLYTAIWQDLQAIIVKQTILLRTKQENGIVDTPFGLDSATSRKPKAAKKKKRTYRFRTCPRPRRLLAPQALLRVSQLVVGRLADLDPHALVEPPSHGPIS
jgi:hypothetical protein